MSRYGDDTRGNAREWIFDEMMLFVQEYPLPDLMQIVADVVKEKYEQVAELQEELERYRRYEEDRII